MPYNASFNTANQPGVVARPVIPMLGRKKQDYQAQSQPGLHGKGLSQCKANSVKPGTEKGTSGMQCSPSMPTAVGSILSTMGKKVSPGLHS